MMGVNQKLLRKWLNSPTIIVITTATFLVIWQYLDGELPPLVQYLFFAALMLLSGIPHGAIDHLVEEQTAKLQRRPFTISVFLIKYVALILGYSLVWLLSPSVSLMFFLLISAWHFGETDIEHAPATLAWNITRLLAGGFVISFILLHHANETARILRRISRNSDQVMGVWSWIENPKTPFLITFGLLLLAAFVCAYALKPILIRKSRYIPLIVILTLSVFLPLLPAFALYFGGWHAVQSFTNMQEFLSLTPGGVATDKAPLWQVWSKTIAFNILAVVGLLSAWIISSRFFQHWDPLPLLFIFLSVITLPHLVVVHGMNKLKSKLQ
jgi:beta-carotene 15,15'-dioxygenase